MDNTNNVTTRYSDADLSAFKAVIDAKLAKATDQYQSLKEQLKDITENNNDDFAKDITDFSSIQTEVEMLNNMANHQRKYIQDLENALIRINNKSYGICTVTGELIDKKRLLAVPTTTKSVLAKTQAEMKDVQQPKERGRGFDDIEEDEDLKPVKKETRKPVIIDKIISKKNTKPSAELDEDDIDKIFSELDVIKELDEAEISISDDDEDDLTTSYDDEDDLDMVADEDDSDYDDEDDM
jgi:RNA polymerase-binding transcription factor DksA